MEQTQQGLILQIQQVSKQIVIFQDDVDIVGHFYAARSNYYAALANTYNNLIEQVVQFTAAAMYKLSRIFSLRRLLIRTSGQQEAAVLGAVVKLTELGLSVAAKFA